MQPSFSATALVLRKLTSYVPKPSIDARCLTPLLALPLADPRPLDHDPIDLIIGADVYGSILRPGLRSGVPGQPIAQCTALGWLLSGPATGIDSPPTSHLASTTPSDSLTILHCARDVPLDNALRKFWEVEELPRVAFRTPADEQCEEHFRSTHSRDSTGRYIVRLPFKRGPPIAIGESRARAVFCLTSILRRLQRDPNHGDAYSAFLREYEDLGHMVRVPSTDPSPSQVVYIPHHPVVRAHSLTTNLRVVFNASSQSSNGTSLNDHLLALAPNTEHGLSSRLECKLAPNPQ